MKSVRDLANALLRMAALASEGKADVGQCAALCQSTDTLIRLARLEMDARDAAATVHWLSDQTESVISELVVKKSVAAEPDKPTNFINGAGSEDSNEDWGSMHQGSIKLGLSLSEPFSPTDLEARLDGDDTRKKAHQWIAEWKGKGWVSTVSFNNFKRTEKFGARK